MVKSAISDPTVASTMKDVLGWRKKFGVLGPSTNTVVQPDFDDMRPVGVTNHYSRIFTPNTSAVSNDTFMSGARLIGRNTIDAVRSVADVVPRLPRAGDVGGDVLRWAGRGQGVPGLGRGGERAQAELRLARMRRRSAPMAASSASRFSRHTFRRPTRRSAGSSTKRASRWCVTSACRPDLDSDRGGDHRCLPPDAALARRRRRGRDHPGRHQSQHGARRRRPSSGSASR